MSVSCLYQLCHGRCPPRPHLCRSSPSLPSQPPAVHLGIYQLLPTSRGWPRTLLDIPSAQGRICLCARGPPVPRPPSPPVCTHTMMRLRRRPPACLVGSAPWPDGLPLTPLAPLPHPRAVPPVSVAPLHAPPPPPATYPQAAGTQQVEGRDDGPQDGPLQTTTWAAAWVGPGTRHLLWGEPASSSMSSRRGCGLETGSLGSGLPRASRASPTHGGGWGPGGPGRECLPLRATSPQARSFPCGRGPAGSHLPRGHDRSCVALPDPAWQPCCLDKGGGGLTLWVCGQPPCSSACH